MIELNKRNKRILKALDLDARQSNMHIAKKLRVNKNVVNYNIKKLEELGLIKGYNAIVDASKLGFFFFRVYIDFYERDLNIDKELIEHLIKLPEAGEVARVVGSWDVVAGFYVRDVRAFRRLWHKVLIKFRKHIKKYNIDLVTDEVMFRRAYLLDEKKDLSEHKWVTGSGEISKVDELDLEILKMLVEDARIPIKDIALKTKMSSMAIIYRVKQLLKRGIIGGYRVNIDFDEIDHEYFRVNIELDDVSISESLMSFCQMHPNIVKVIKSVSEFDFEFDMEILDFDQFLAIIDEIKAKFPGVVRDYNYFKIVEYYKRQYLPV
ncbi:Lrp/AsnC family transcriptional regulator [Candidatus Woesearchaeota archaeon]|jgi:DNA-binding Lrp family transcriptional regulator|nr:Lrp/AsnC family transcriptional regulator [Candidatus Woesearchaeota archaeon]MBT7368865.1 Lrp/AsnC family transcriptional regulator [Candidatus Woesearchaeota archaeon]